jgi:hypothetical protein
MAFPSPALEPPTLESFQYQYNSLKFGAGTAYGVLFAEGLDLAEIRSGDVNWPRDHGQAKGLDLYGGRDIIFDLWMKTDGTSLQHAQLALAAATVVRPDEELPLWFQLPNLPLLCIMCRPRKRPMKVESDYAAAQIGKPELHLRATDPRIYTAGVETEIKPNHPATSKTLNNTGNTEMRPILVFTGPLARPTATNKAIAGEPFLTFSLAIPFAELERNTREQAERSAKATRESEEEAARIAREKLEVEERIAAEKAEKATRESHEETVAKAQEKAELEEAVAKKVKEEAKETYISPRETREVEEKIAQAKWEQEHRGTKESREKEEAEDREEAEVAEINEREEDEYEEVKAGGITLLKAEAKAGDKKVLLRHNLPVGTVFVIDSGLGTEETVISLKVTKIGVREYEIETAALKFTHVILAGVRVTANAAEVEEEEDIAAHEASEKAGELPTVAAGHQIVIDTGTPHRALYYENLTRTGTPKNVLGWLTTTSTWWDLIPGNNPIQFSSYDAGETAGKLVIEWASADQL